MDQTLAQQRRERKRQKDKIYYHKNKERILAKLATYDSQSPERKRERMRRAWEKKKKDPIKMALHRARATKQNRLRDGCPEPDYPMPMFCECCGFAQQGRALSLDHCHETGKFRGWLCDKCNMGIGLLGDNSDGLLQALKYILR